MKILASDFDGTIYFPDGIHQEDIDAIDTWQKDNKFGLCTGRPLNGAIEGLEGKVHCDFMLLVSGALIVDENYNIIYKETVEPEILNQIIETYKDQTKSIVIQGNDRVYSYYGLSYQDHLNSLEAFKGNLFGASFCIESVEKAKMIVTSINTNYPSIKAYQNKNYIDLVSAKVSKGTAIQFIKDYYQSELIAGIGDSYNDMAMLEKADVSFTFHNSPIEVKKVANHYVSSIKEAIEILNK